ncbi:unnamed protein product [Linum tenue]|uniref:Uncharacterized protein n=1 Tax=Linum tenue TaxID=586396 RepID=A0AAV0QA28_9ROSI|nr:unnamed protein product [Linum tenue]
MTRINREMVQIFFCILPIFGLYTLRTQHL